jgi:2-amino-4-hydroxy-6-hydroxymethyldihydropteridine diphosphokinase
MVDSKESENPSASPELDCVVGLGSNQGQSLDLLRSAVARLGELGVVSAVSELYLTDPVGGPKQGRYLNAAVRWRRRGTPIELLRALRNVESAHGRQRGERWGPRTLDLDLLWIAGVRCSQVCLQVPHPRLTERAFALAPLIDVAPEAVDPETGESYSRRLREIGRSGVARLTDRRHAAASSGSPNALWTHLLRDGTSRATARRQTVFPSSEFTPTPLGSGCRAPTPARVGGIGSNPAAQDDDH